MRFNRGHEDLLVVFLQPHVKLVVVLIPVRWSPKWRFSRTEMTKFLCVLYMQDLQLGHTSVSPFRTALFNVNIFLIANRKASHYKNYRCETVVLWMAAIGRWWTNKSSGSGPVRTFLRSFLYMVWQHFHFYIFFVYQNLTSVSWFLSIQSSVWDAVKCQDSSLFCNFNSLHSFEKINAWGKDLWLGRLL